ncbi:hypothetical protein G9A89_011455 [Geosiphon pyriformis]|nr:hypothetical protein G9A89_011455 [Geosiphon pyriformis]
MRGEVCNQTCQYVLSISEKVRRGAPFDITYNSVINKLYHYLYDAKKIFDLAIALINRATQENIHQIKKAKYIEYIIELAEFNYEDKVETYHQIASHTYSIQKCPKYYALSISLPSENNQKKIEFGKPKTKKKIATISIYLIENQSAIQFKYFDNNRQRIKPKKAHELDAEYNLRYSGKDTLVLQPKSLTKINLKIALKIPPEAMIQIAS